MANNTNKGGQQDPPQGSGNNNDSATNTTGPNAQSQAMSAPTHFVAATGPILGSTGTIQGNNSTFVAATNTPSNAQVSPIPQFGTQGTPPPNQGFGDQRQWRDPPYGMPYSYMAETPEEQPGRVVLVDRNQNADEVIHRVRQNNHMETNLTTMIERIMAQNDLNTGLRRPNYTSPLSDYVLQVELPRGRKVPKFTKFSGDTSESTTEHIARYMTEVGDLANNEDLRVKYFPSSLTKNAFTWFTTLPPNSIDTWSQFRLLKARCFTVVPEHELVEMAVGGLDYSIRKKLDTQYLRDMAQMIDRVRQVKRLKVEKARANKSYKKDRVTYVEVDEEEPETFEDQHGFEDCEVDLAELKEAGPYTCKMITPSNGKNPVEIEKNDKFPKKTYTFNVTKCDKIFDLLVKDGQMVLPPNIKIPPFEQRK
ncbi:uncharacterized protein LOC131626086 [Vicia villosa]|uniref:uncharacterized protein LOC131626086 n=1 Tax=Vicia villosa TaxID=3911 RepID=UPI00273A8983|nr:uncharacterized protein LOC131626086 [Vicia villosa]